MGKRKSQQLPGGDGKCQDPKPKRGAREDSEAMGDDGLDRTGLAQSGDANGKPTLAAGGKEDREETTGSNAGMRSGNVNGEAVAPEQSWAGEQGPSPSSQEGRELSTTGGVKSLEPAVPGVASLPESPQKMDLAAREAEEDPVVATERDGSAGEEQDANTQIPHGTGDIGGDPERSSTEGAAGREIPVDIPGGSSSSSVPAAGPDPHHEEYERQSGAVEIQESTSVVSAKENESGAVSESVARGEEQENRSGERPQAAGTDGRVENTAEAWQSPAGGIGSGDPEVEGGTGTAGGNASPWKTVGEGDTGREEAGEGETPSPDISAVPDPAVLSLAVPSLAVPNPAELNPMVPDPAGERDREGLTERTARPDTQHPARSGEVMESVPALPMTPGPDPAGTAQLPVPGTAPAVSVESQDQPCSARNLDGNSPKLQKEQPIPVAERGDSAEPCATAGRSPAEVMPPPCAKGNGPEPPRPRSEEPEQLHPPTRKEDTTDATDIVCGLILELSNLNRLAMSAHRGLEALRRPKVRRSRWPGTVHAGRRWKEM